MAERPELRDGQLRDLRGVRDGEFEVEVATGPDADPDGTLADAGQVDAYVAPMDPRVTADVFTALTDLDAAWLATLGTYYWQAYRRVVRTQSSRRPRALVSRCTLPTSFLAECRLTWRDARHRYRVSARLESTAGGMLAEIDGKRIRRACKRRCRSAVHWTVATVASA